MGNRCSCFAGITNSLFNDVPRQAQAAEPPHSPADPKKCKALSNMAKLGGDLGELLHDPAVDIDWANPEFFNYTALHLAANMGHEEVGLRAPCSRRDAGSAPCSR